MNRRKRGTGTIEKTRDGRHRARLTTETGERIPLGVYDTREEAETVLASAAAELVDRKLAPMLGVTLRMFGVRFLEARAAEGARGIDTDRNRWAVHVNASELADMPLKAIERRDAKSWLTWMLSKKIRYAHKHSRNGRKLSRITVQNALNLVRKAFDVAVDEEFIQANPFRGIKLPPFKGATHEPWTYLTPVEQDALLNALPWQERPLVAFALGTGLRQGEQWSLRWEDVGADEIVVRYGADGKPTKSGKIRRVPLFGLGMLGIQLSTRPRRGLVFPASGGQVRQKGEPPHWKAWLRMAGITRNVRWHDLRHTCASSLVAGWWGRRWSLEEVKGMLGHASITTTERYAHLADSALKLAAGETVGPAVSPLALPEASSATEELPLNIAAGATSESRTRDLRFTKSQATVADAPDSQAIEPARGLSGERLLLAYAAHSVGVLS